MAILYVFIIAFLSLTTAHGQDFKITISAGGMDRVETIVAFPLPQPVEAGTYPVTDDFGNKGVVQVDEENRGWFLLEELTKKSTKTYHLSSHSTLPGDSISYTTDSHTISFHKQDQPAFQFYRGDNTPPGELDERYERGGYIHPIYTPEGVPLTNHLDSQIHPHHFGVWAAWTKTQFRGRSPDFWNLQNSTARIDHSDSLKAVWEGPVYGGLKAVNEYVDLLGSGPVKALNEEWNVRVFNTGGADYHIIDVTVRHTANSDRPLVLPEYHYGGFAFRGHSDWNSPENVSLITSEGYDRMNANARRARWIHMGGLINGRLVGVAVMGHPKNFRAPQPVRVHPETPYLVFAPMQLGEMSIEPGSPYVMRYRLVTYDGKLNKAMLNRLWNDYAYPPGVTVEVKALSRDN